MVEVLKDTSLQRERGGGEGGREGGGKRVRGRITIKY